MYTESNLQAIIVDACIINVVKRMHKAWRYPPPPDNMDAPAFAKWRNLEFPQVDSQRCSAKLKIGPLAARLRVNARLHQKHSTWRECDDILQLPLLRVYHLREFMA